MSRTTSTRTTSTRTTSNRGAPTTHATPSRRGPAILVAAVGLVVGLLASLVQGPHGLRPTDSVHGDDELAQALLDAGAGARGTNGVSAVVLDGEGARFASVGEEPVAPDHHVELGSITKTFNGHLLADAIERGEVTAQDTLEMHLPELVGTPAGGATLGDIAQHRSGLPRLLPSGAWSNLRFGVGGHDPYTGYDEARVLAESAQLERVEPGEFAYSNLGLELLAQALVRASSAPDWSTLVDKRLFTPLGMDDTVIATTAEQVPQDARQGRMDNGAPMAPWVTEGFAPSGTSTWSTGADMERYARAVVEGTAPGMAAIEPTAHARTDEQGIGWLWLTLDPGIGREVLYHNGATGGATSVLYIDRGQGTAVFAANASQLDVDDIGAMLLDPSAAEGPSDGAPQPVVGYALLAMLAGHAIAVWRKGPSTHPVRWASAAMDLATMGLVVWRFGPWSHLPGPVFGALAGLGVAGLAVAGIRLARRGTTRPADAGAWVLFGISAAVLAAVLALIV